MYSTDLAYLFSIRFSPLFIGSSRSTTIAGVSQSLSLGFSPLFIGASRSTLGISGNIGACNRVSVPSSLGHRVQPSTKVRRTNRIAMFQSPLHWGIAFNEYNISRIVIFYKGFNPLILMPSLSFLRIHSEL